MKVLILAAGYGTRLEADIREDKSGNYKHLLGVPKPLVPVAGRPLISHWTDDLKTLKNLVYPRDVFIVVNKLHYDRYVKWAQLKEVGLPVDHIINDGTTGNDNRIGAIADIQLVIDSKKIDDDLMIVGGDTLFFDDFSLQKVVGAFTERKDNLVLWYETVDTQKTGILEANEKGIVTNFLEKPHPSTTKSRMACPCFYIYRKASLPLIKTFIASTGSVKERDAPGNLLCWLHSRSEVFAYKISGRFDIGGLETYIECETSYQKRIGAAKKLDSGAAS
jgi:NDP-sugar pyrophosphorylase family protein